MRGGQVVVALVALAVGLWVESRCRIVDAVVYASRYGQWPRKSFCLGLGGVSETATQRTTIGRIPGGDV